MHLITKRERKDEDECVNIATVKYICMMQKRAGWKYYTLQGPTVSKRKKLIRRYQ